MLFVVNADGSGGLKRLTRYADRGWSWSPDGKRIAYVGISAGGRKALFIVNTVGSPQPRRIDVSIPSGGPAPSYFTPTWSPDGTRLAFECCANGYQPNGNWIYLVRPDGSGLTRAYQGDIRGWSPDGRSFLVSRGFNALWKLFLVRSDGTFVRRVPGCSSGCGYVTWLPDSKSDRLQRATPDLRRPGRRLNAPSRRHQPFGVPPVFGLRGRVDDRLRRRRVSARTHQASVDRQDRRLASAGRCRVVHGRVLEPGVAPSPTLKSPAASGHGAERTFPHTLAGEVERSWGSRSSPASELPTPRGRARAPAAPEPARARRAG